MDRRAGIALAAILGAVWGWWGSKSGAYFGTVFYPGAVLLLLLSIALLLAAPAGFRLRGPALAAPAALAGLAGWSLVSIAWTPAEDAAVADGFHVLSYAAAFLLGIWLCRLLAREPLLALAPVAIGAGIAAAVTVPTLWLGEDFAAYLHEDGSLRFPLGYRNANAAFFLIALWPAIALAASRSLAPGWRAAALSTASVSLGIAVLSQSRGSLVAAAVSVLPFAVLYPRRLRAAVWFGLAVVPVAVALPVLLDVYQEGVPIQDALPLLDRAALALVAIAIAAAVIGIAATRIEPRVALSAQTGRTLERGLGVALLLVVLAGSAVYAGRHGGPVELFDQKFEELSQAGTPELHGQGARFGTNFGSNRGDFWRVARRAAADEPLLGEGAGAFGFRYARERRSAETPSDPHSAEMLMLAELGIPGLLLFAVAVGSAAAAALRSRLLGPPEAALAAGALAAGAYWLIQASVDWFWNYPALTAPVFCLLGAAAGPALLESGARAGAGLRRAGALAAAAATLLAVPLFLSERYTAQALDGWREDAVAALADLDRAGALNPLAVRPPLIEGEVAAQLGERERAAAALREAVARQPRSWVAHLFLGRLLLDTDPAEARRELELARSLNPNDPEVRELLERPPASHP